MSKLMIVDDEIVLATQLEDLVISMGHQIAGIASNGEEALEMAAQLKPDLILMDIVMPGKLNGIETAERIKETSDVPMVFLAAYADKEMLDRAKSIKPHGYIFKPFREEQIRVTIEISLYKNQIEKRLQESEKRYRGLFEDCPISLWEEDFSEVKIFLDKLKDSGVKDIKAYFCDNPETLVDCAKKVRIIDVNKHSVKLYNAEAKAELCEGLDCIFDDESYGLFIEELIAISQGKNKFESEGVNRTLNGERKHIAMSWAVAPDHEKSFSKVLVSIIDVTDRKEAEKALKNAHDELEQKVEERTAELRRVNKEIKARTSSLEEMNIALKVLLGKRDEDKRDLELKVMSNLQDTALPYLEKLKKSGLNPRQEAFTRILEGNLKDMISPFANKLSSKFKDLTPAEVQIANLIKQGKTTKETAAILNLSRRTVDTHRANIRKKLRIKNQKSNLRSYLLSME